MLLILLLFAKILNILNKNEKLFVVTNYYCYNKYNYVVSMLIKNKPFYLKNE